MLEITTEYKGAKYRYDPGINHGFRMCGIEVTCDECPMDEPCYGGWVKVEEDETIKKVKEFAVYLLDYPSVSCGEWTTEPFVDEVYDEWIAGQRDGIGGSEC